MTARLAAAAFVSALGVAVAAGCGGNEAARERGGGDAARPDVSAQVAARNLLEKEEGSCGCTGEARARERLADGRATRRTQPVVLGR